MKRVQPRVVLPYALAVIAFALFAWLFYTTLTGNPFWFQPPPERSYQPAQIVIHYYGETVTLEPESEPYEALNGALNQALARFNGRIPIGLSDETLQAYREGEFVLEARFVGDVGETIGLGLPLNQVLIPIDGRHANQRYAFVGQDGEWLASALLMEEPQPLLDILTQLGYTKQ